MYKYPKFETEAQYNDTKTNYLQIMYENGVA